MTSPRLELRGLYQSFGAVQVLHDVDLSIRPGEVSALVGDNGAVELVTAGRSGDLGLPPAEVAVDLTTSEEEPG